jgi:hypothetical protein
MPLGRSQTETRHHPMDRRSLEPHAHIDMMEHPRTAYGRDNRTAVAALPHREHAIVGTMHCSNVEISPSLQSRAPRKAKIAGFMRNGAWMNISRHVGAWSAEAFVR